MPTSVAPTDPNLGLVDKTIRNFEETTQRRVSTPGRLVIQQFFISLAMDRVGFSKSMSDNDRRQAIQTAQSNLYSFLDSLGQRVDKGVKSEAGYWDTDPAAKPEIGLLLIVQNINSWAKQIGCPCWPE
jgi:hypothetical protein